ncbi:tetratricopeptide repeat protein (macronuclear) [Tetrahymena thermophila SB210]|uniref:Tetratricopeptide repeat protein n=1 Tax=Tetrahymena thermophila (strain SB210) TaxID=312017 RepID=Q24HV0_TETTS|nr:tetratricopeptide repeat protein [Tetrahymena thermophila SB210]EAS07337.2 tetratricopeptide repeat protein [Tetrahymena thermophila SB210]|eukprot:XP_001027579.2 tetratricopeptide repeat protein [Tetrahymena thermophila SB210]
MKRVILTLIVTVSLPIIIGVAIVLAIYYNILQNALDQWQDDSIQWINQLQQQILKNSAYSSQVLLEYSFNQLELHMVVVAGLIKKYQNAQIIYNPKTIFTICSYREFTYNECPQYVYDQLNESLFYGDLYFVRSQFKFNLLTPQQQYFIKTNDFISFYGRAAFQATQTQGLIQISNIYNSDNTSAQTLLPSVFYNYTESSYETCYGTNYTEPYDPRCRDWFVYAQNNKGIFIYEPYTDALTGNILMSLSTQMEYESQFYSVDTIDFTMQNIVKLFDSNQSENQYSVLIHEFNSTVLYHPLLVFQQVTAWADVEFFNTNQFCRNSQEQMDLCQQQQYSFSDQVNKTIEYIKTGNYTIDNQTSLSQLYQQWERFGQKQVSIVLPVQSKLRGYNNQKPYSFAIILVGRSLKEQQSYLQQFNKLSLNKNEANLSGQKRKQSQVKETIDKKLRKLKQNQQYQGSFQKYSQNQSQNQTVLNDTKQRSLFEEESSKQCGNGETEQYLNDKTFQNNIQKYKFDNLQLKNSNSIFTYQRNSFNQQNNLFKSLGENKAINYSGEQVINSESNSDQYQLRNQSFQQNSLERSVTFKLPNTSLKQSNFSKLSTRSQSISEVKILQKKKENDKKKILQGLKPLFLEMKIIKKVFQDLEILINYKIDAQNQNQQDNMNTLFHFSKAKVTFQQLKNQTGLSRCYFNLGIIYLIKYDYQLASEYFEATIQVSLQMIGISQENLINQKILNLNKKNYENPLLIITKKIVSSAYSLKEQALSLIYQDFISLQGFQIPQKFNKQIDASRIICDQTNEINALLKTSLNKYQIIYNLVLQNDKSFSVIFKIFLLQEIIEIMINLKSYQKNKNDLKDLVQLLVTAKNLQEKLNQSFIKRFTQGSKVDQQISIYENNQDVKAQIFEIQKSRQYFLNGFLEQIQNNLKNAAEQFTFCLEEGTYYNKTLRKKAIYHLNQIFRKTPLYQLVDIKFDLYQEMNKGIDIVFLIQLEYQIQNSSVEQCLKDIQQNKLMTKNDKMLILIFHTELDIFMPFTNTYSETHYNQIINSFQSIQRVLIQEQKNSKKNLHWKQALFQSFQHVYQHNKQDQLYLEQFYNQLNGVSQNNLGNFKYDINYSKSMYQNQLQERKKVILLFSKDEQEFNQKFNQNYLIFQQKFMNSQKPHVYHIKEYNLLTSVCPEQNFENLIYQVLIDESQIVSKLKKLRNQENLNDHQEFLSVLNNA